MRRTKHCRYCPQCYAQTRPISCTNYNWAWIPLDLNPVIQNAQNGKRNHANYCAISGILVDALCPIQIALVERVFFLRLLYRRTEDVINHFLQFERRSPRDRTIAVNMSLLIRHE